MLFINVSSRLLFARLPSKTPFDNSTALFYFTI